MRVLTEKTEIRSAIQQVLSDPKDERIVLVAYVGAGALDFLPKPKGVKIFCWPQAGGTNPKAVSDLLRKGADVQFVKRLHAKVYWSRTKGAVVGSANLTENALGERAQHEVAVALKSDAVDMKQLLTKLNVIRDRDAALKRLWKQHNEFYSKLGKRGSGGARSSEPIPTFAEWYATRTGGPSWRLSFYTREGKPADDATKKYWSETGYGDYAYFLSTERDDALEKRAFALALRVPKKGRLQLKKAELEWWMPDYMTKSEESGYKEDPIHWFARGDYSKSADQPFKLDKKFKAALVDLLNERGGYHWMSMQRGAYNLNSQFLRDLYHKYLRASRRSSRRT